MTTAVARTGTVRRVTVVCLLLAGGAMAAQTVEISRHMRPVQCDGFLLEWREADARAVAGVPGATWDAANTADGLAGYVRVSLQDACGPAGALLSTDRGELLGALRFDGPPQGRAQAAVDSSHTGERVMEFVLPWESAALDSAGCYAVALAVHTACDSARGAVRLAGCRGTLAARVLTPRIRMQITVIVVLLTAYVLMSLRVRKTRTNRTQ